MFKDRLTFTALPGSAWVKIEPSAVEVDRCLAFCSES